MIAQGCINQKDGTDGASNETSATNFVDKNLEIAGLPGGIPPKI
jgi:hypothetical protein